MAGIEAVGEWWCLDTHTVLQIELPSKLGSIPRFGQMSQFCMFVPQKRSSGMLEKVSHLRAKTAGLLVGIAAESPIRERNIMLRRFAAESRPVCTLCSHGRQGLGDQCAAD